MRNAETHFAQVPIEVAETTLRQNTATVRMPEQSTALVSVLYINAAAEFLKQEENAPSKEQP